MVLIIEAKSDSVLTTNSLVRSLKYYNLFYVVFGIYVVDTFTNFAIMKILTRTVIPGISNWVPNSANIFS